MKSVRARIADWIARLYRWSLPMLRDEERTTVRAITSAFADDEAFRAYALKHGLRELACTFDALDPTALHVLSDFSAANHFAHLLWRGRDPKNPT